MTEPRTSLEYFGFGHIQKKLDDLTRERNSLALQLDSCQGALREVIAENTANCDRADMAEAVLAKAQEEIRRLKELT